MHKIGDKVMYGAAGVMTIVDIREESIADTCRSYYVLVPTLSRSDSQTFVPTDNERLVATMRPLLTKDEIVALYNGSTALPEIEWVTENRARQEYFKRLMESGDRGAMLSMIRAIDESAARREAEGKKNFLTDENAKAKAIKLLHSEIAVVLDIPEDEVSVFLKQLT
ncbi:MAG: hypothetical protein J6V80_03700 [Clostridia bacterium]|nr:hypothetical protein [Clostridia bacterium]